MSIPEVSVFSDTRKNLEKQILSKKTHKEVDVFIRTHNQRLNDFPKRIVGGRMKSFPSTYKNIEKKQTIEEAALAIVRSLPWNIKPIIDPFNEEERYKIALLLAEKFSNAFSLNIKKFAIVNPNIRYQCALIVAKNNPLALIQNVESFHIEERKKLFELGYFCWQRLSSAFIKRKNAFGIQSESCMKEFATYVAHKDPETLSLYVKDFMLGQDLASEQPLKNYRKYLAHVWSINGDSSIVSDSGSTHIFHLEGFSRIYPLSMLAKSFKTFTRLFKKEAFFCKVQTALDLATQPFNLTDALSIIKANQPYVLLGGFPKHTISFTFCKHFLLIGNRGMRSHRQAGIEIYFFPIEKVNESFLAMLSKNHLNPDEFQKKLNSFDLKLVGFITMKEQKAGNCAWVSSKCALLSLFWTLEIDHPNSRKNYKLYTTFERIRALNQYLPDRDDGLWKALSLKLPKYISLFCDQWNLDLPEIKETKTYSSFCQMLDSFKRQIKPLFPKEDCYYGIQDEAHLIELAKICARKNPKATKENLDNFRILDPLALEHITVILASTHT